MVQRAAVHALSTEVQVLSASTAFRSQEFCISAPHSPIICLSCLRFLFGIYSSVFKVATHSWRPLYRPTGERRDWRVPCIARAGKSLASSGHPLLVMLRRSLLSRDWESDQTAASPPQLCWRKCTYMIAARNEFAFTGVNLWRKG